MQSIQNYIQRRADEMASHALFGYLGDRQIDAAIRFKFAARSTHFILTYSDILRFLLSDESTTDEYQRIVNTHCAEERAHAKWFLMDLKTLGQDPEHLFTDSVNVLWGDDTIKTRLLGYRLSRLSMDLKSIDRVVLLEAIEAMSALAFKASAPAATELEQRTGKALLFFGQRHLDSELNHQLAEESVHEKLASVKFDGAARDRLIAVVDQVLTAFAEYFDEVYSLTTRP